MRTVLFDEEGVSTYINDLYRSNKSVEVGLLVGQASANRDYIVGVVPTPPPDNAESLRLADLDPSWVVEHSRQIWRMSNGSLAVRGVYVFCERAAVKQCESAMLQVLPEIAYADPAYAHAKDVEGSASAELLMFTVPKDSKADRNCKSYNFTDSKTSSGAATTWKEQTFINKYYEFECTTNMKFSSFLSGLKEDGAGDENVGCMADVGNLLDMLMDSVAMMNGEFVNGDTLLSTLKMGQTYNVKLLSPVPLCVGPTPPSKTKGGTAVVSVDGNIVCRAYAFNGKDTLATVYQSLRMDLIRSLLARMQIVNDDVNNENEESDLFTKSGSYSLPARVYVPFVNKSAAKSPYPVLCDYKMKGETAEDIQDRCKEMIGRNSDLYEDKDNFGFAEETQGAPPVGSRKQAAAKPKGTKPAGQGGNNAGSGDGAAGSNNSSSNSLVYIIGAGIAALSIAAVGVLGGE
eukprot:GFYU01008367.1.p1 GENE.GFYU01008367.1~~GFYU01008367.1.p1  ORF type:complete len:460 (+),score=119.59 GFYU01008367.1:21-1400(+)